jgi:hypothetical protein
MELDQDPPKTKDHAAGEVISVSKSEADVLIANGIAEATEAPAEVTQKTTAIDAEFDTKLDAKVKAGIAEAMKSLPAATVKDAQGRDGWRTGAQRPVRHAQVGQVLREPQELPRYPGRRQHEELRRHG